MLSSHCILLQPTLDNLYSATEPVLGLYKNGAIRNLIDVAGDLDIPGFERHKIYQHSTHNRRRLRPRPSVMPSCS